jgi:hypothetical protein
VVDSGEGDLAHAATSFGDGAAAGRMPRR